jgi:hypothetical protein
MMFTSGIKYFIFSLLLLGAIDCKSASGNTPTPPGKTDEFATASELMELYDSSFRSLFYRHVSREGFAFEQLALMYKIYTEYSIWANVDREGRLVSISRGKSHVILAAYEPGHPFIRQPGPTLVTNKEQFVTIHIRPNRISKDFAGIFLVHEISHVLDYLNNTNSDSSDANETKAYLHEKQAANIAYDLAIDRGLDEILAQLKPKDVSDLIELRQTSEGRQRLQKLLIGIEKNTTIEPPASMAEAEMRLGFYNVALELRRQENLHKGKNSYSISAEKVGQLLRAASKY